MKHIIVIAHNIRSSYNIGSIIRTSEGFGVSELIISGYSPYPKLDIDDRLPHIASKVNARIVKVSLGAEKHIKITHSGDILASVNRLKSSGYFIAGLEQSKTSINLRDFKPPDKLCLILGEEVEGISSQLLKACDQIVEIPMAGSKESFNVSVATGVFLFFVTNII